MKAALTQWLARQQPVLEKALLDAAQSYYNDNVSRRNFEFDTRKTGAELYYLGNGEDLCYDRPSIGFNYSLWYHPRRINTFLQFFTHLMYEARNEDNIQIFDLGAGTGAVLWAVGVVSAGLKALGMSCPRMQVVNIDTSAFMLSYNYDYLWKSFLKHYPGEQHICGADDYKLISWNTADHAYKQNVWVCASYLFDQSDNMEELSNDFRALVKKINPQRIILLTTQRKVRYCEGVADKINAEGYISQSIPLQNPIFRDTLPELTRFRKKISQEHNLDLRGDISWNIDNMLGMVLLNSNPSIFQGLDEINLFVKPEKNRAKIILTEQQQAAAELTNSPTLIVGPAGCGKSVVLTQKVKNIVESAGRTYDPGLHILVTTFNRLLVKHLGDWLEQILDPEKCRRVISIDRRGNPAMESKFFFGNAAMPNIEVMHFDLIPTRLVPVNYGKISPRNVHAEVFQRERMADAVNRYLAVHTSTDKKRFAKILNPDFLLDEYQRVVYGLECNDKTRYLDVDRVGRGGNPKLDKRKQRREIVWAIISDYLRALKKDGFDSFIYRRHRVINKLRKNEYSPKFTHILVDEFQDCTRADYEIFYQLIADPNQITFAGDIAQSINIGSSLHYPARSEEQEMNRFRSKRLEGSFRLPVRVSECIRPFSEEIASKMQRKANLKSDIINPYKGAPPGARPVYVFAPDEEAAARKINEVYQVYKPLLNLDKITVYENDTALCNTISESIPGCESEIILKSKGLEKSCVVWSARMPVESTEETDEFVYTILTRTVSLLIILLLPGIPERHITILSSFNYAKRGIFWDEETQQQHQQLISGKLPDNEADDDDDSAAATEDNNTAGMAEQEDEMSTLLG